MGCVKRRTAFQSIYSGYSSKKQLFSGFHDQNTEQRCCRERRRNWGREKGTKTNALVPSTVIDNASN